MEEDKGESRQEDGGEEMKRAPLPTAVTKPPAVDQGDGQSVVPTLTSDFVRMIVVCARLLIFLAYGFAREKSLILILNHDISFLFVFSPLPMGD